MAKMKTSMIRVTSRASIKIHDNFYTVEYTEERIVPDGIKKIDLEKEREELWDLCNAECDKQTEDIKKMFDKYTKK